MKPKTKSRAGPKLSSSVSQSGVGGFGGSARMLTLYLMSDASRLSLAKVGRSVMKLVALGCPEPPLTAFLVVPVIEFPVAVTFTTLPAVISLRKTSYGMVTEGGVEAASMMLVTTKLTRSSAKMNTQNRRHPIGL